MTRQTRGPRVHERWAHLRFSVIGQLLAAPPAKGELKAAIEGLAGRTWQHPTTGEPVRFGFALVTGAPGTGKSVTLRILAERLGAQRDVRIGIVTRPQAGLADFYREMGDLFGVELAPHNRWAGAKVLRDRWQTHIDAALSRPVLTEMRLGEMAALHEVQTA
jgi:hypothetical protein